jgi:hypothetical protein
MQTLARQLIYSGSSSVSLSKILESAVRHTKAAKFTMTTGSPVGKGERYISIYSH